MVHHCIDLVETGQFPKLLLDYLANKSELSAFHAGFPDAGNAKKLIASRQNFPLAKRRQLVDVLKRQYADIPNAPDFTSLLDKNTFTVTTGHQLNILTGPLFVIYKIITTINLARELGKIYPDFRFVPVYWMATEDHDFDEIAVVNLFGKDFRWEVPHKGAVGRLAPKGMAALIDQLPVKLPLFRNAYSSSDTLTEAVRRYMHELFGTEGLISLDADTIELKRAFVPVIKEELAERSTGKLVAETTGGLHTLGYDPPVHARDINLFYLKDQLRERIVENDGTFSIIDTRISFTLNEILKEAEDHPENFSPNVVLRPLYQETILPNLAYVGGPSEIPYWLQLKGVFGHFKQPFPLLIPRNFALYINKAESRRMQKLGLGYGDLFKGLSTLRKSLVEKSTRHTLNLKAETKAMEEVLQSITEKALAIDKTMEAAVSAEEARLRKSLKKLENRLYKAEEKKHGIALEQLATLMSHLFPRGAAQERHDNFIPIYLQNNEFLNQLLASFDPFDFRFNILIEE